MWEGRVFVLQIRQEYSILDYIVDERRKTVKPAVTEHLPASGQPTQAEQALPQKQPDTGRIRKTVWHLLPFVTALLTVVLCMTVLYAGSNVGLSDNGDFRRVLAANYMDYADSTDNRYLFKDQYVMSVTGGSTMERLGSLFATSQDEVEYTSPHFAFIKLSKLLNYWSNCITGQPPETYSLWWLALLYSLLLGGAAYLLVHAFQKLSSRIIAGLVFLLIFCDAGYILYFNSFYGEALQFVTLLLLAGLTLHLLKKPKNYLVLVLFYLTLYLFAGSKLANIPYAILAAQCSLVFLLPEKGVQFRAVLSGCVCVTVAALVVLYTSIPAWMDYDTTYQSVFFGVLKSSQTPEQDLAELGLDPELAVLQNTHAYMSEYPIDIHTDDFTAQFYAKTGKVGIALFYLRHPVRLAEKLEVAVQNSATIRPPYLGNSTETRMVQTERYSLWSNVRLASRLLYQPWFVLPFLLLCSLLMLAVLCIQIRWRHTCSRRAIGAAVQLLLLLGGIWIALAIPIIGNGEADLSKHMFLFIQLLDMAVWLLIGTLLAHVRQIARAVARHITRFAVCCALVIAAGTGISVYWNTATHSQTFTLGYYDGEPIVWEILCQNPDGSVTAVSKQPLTVRTFDNTGLHGSNLWSESSLRDWLNGAFLDHFSQAERDRLLSMPHRVLLAEANASRSQGGNHPHYWTGVPQRAADLGDTAYAETVTDRVSLLSLEQYQQGGFRRAAGTPYWLADPYTANGEMVRFADSHGLALYCDANQALGVRPVITVK